jgi:ubiquitin-activating enzyme E1 C
MECTNALAVDRDVYPLCTIAETPRLPEHCILYYSMLKWKDHFDRPLDKDSFDDINWVCEQAKKRGEAFGIQGVNYSLTLGVIKNVIPAIASTNAIIAASTVLEAVKYLSGCSKILDNYFMYMGHEGIYATVNKYEKNESCNVCSTHIRKAKVDKSQTLKELVE